MILWYCTWTTDTYIIWLLILPQFKVDSSKFKTTRKEKICRYDWKWIILHIWSHVFYISRGGLRHNTNYFTVMEDWVGMNICSLSCVVFPDTLTGFLCEKGFIGKACNVIMRIQRIGRCNEEAAKLIFIQRRRNDKDKDIEPPLLWSQFDVPYKSFRQRM